MGEKIEEIEARTLIETTYYNSIKIKNIKQYLMIIIMKNLTKNFLYPAQ